MKVLADTHILIWALGESNKLPEAARVVLVNPRNQIFYSFASVWEIAIKHAAHPDKLAYSGKTFERLCRLAGYIPLSGEMRHVFCYETLSRPDNAPRHNDPFDKFLLAQAKAEKMRFLTHDERIQAYEEPCIIAA